MPPASLVFRRRPLGHSVGALSRRRIDGVATRTGNKLDMDGDFSSDISTGSSRRHILFQGSILRSGPDPDRVLPRCSEPKLRQLCNAKPECGSAASSHNLCRRRFVRSEEHTSELQSLMRISYAVFCLKKKTTQ